MSITHSDWWWTSRSIVVILLDLLHRNVQLLADAVAHNSLVTDGDPANHDTVTFAVRLWRREVCQAAQL